MPAPTMDMTTAFRVHPPGLPGAEHRTLAALFHHPVAHNLPWSDVVALFERLGGVEHRTNGEVVMRLARAHHHMRRPRGKDVGSEDIMALRHFLTQGGFSEASQEKMPMVLNAAPDLLAVVDHRDASIYHIDIASHDIAAHVIRPHDPHHILHHLSHQDHSHAQGQRSPEDTSFYERIADVLAVGDRIVLIGHGTGKSNAADHLAEYLRTHHHDLYQRMARDVVADLSRATPAQLLVIAQSALR